MKLRHLAITVTLLASAVGSAAAQTEPGHLFGYIALYQGQEPPPGMPFDPNGSYTLAQNTPIPVFNGLRVHFRSPATGEIRTIEVPGIWPQEGNNPPEPTFPVVGPNGTLVSAQLPPGQTTGNASAIRYDIVLAHSAENLISIGNWPDLLPSLIMATDFAEPKLSPWRLPREYMGPRLEASLSAQLPNVPLIIYDELQWRFHAIEADQILVSIPSAQLLQAIPLATQVPTIAQFPHAIP